MLMKSKDKGVAKGDVAQYLQETRSWETDRVLEANRSKRLAWRVATAAFAVAFIATVAVAGLTPLKTVEPFIVRIDNTTGIVDAVKGIGDSKTTYGEAVNKYFLQQYVMAREGYMRLLAQHNYRTVGLMSSNQIQQQYYDAFNPKNPQSPLNLYGEYTRAQVIIKGTTFLEKKIAHIRFVKEIQTGGTKPVWQHWSATIGFEFVGTPANDKDREINPLGFIVTSYRLDPESLTAVEAASWKPPQPSVPPLQALSDPAPDIVQPVLANPAATTASAPAALPASN